ncbi:MAG: tyrosine-type recombinase/integrase [Lachnospiraceae bacterium]|nr:tyrosine-type recombinase/integrase [Lachnospiraceae bacterium]
MMNLSEAFDIFIDSREAYCADPTISNYKNTIRYFVDFLSNHKNRSMDEIDVDEITLDDLNKYSIFLKNKVKNEGHPFYPVNTEKLISSRTRKTYLKDMKTFVKFLFDEEHMKENITKRFRMPRSVGKVIEPLTVDEVKLIDENYSSNKQFGIRNLAIIHLLLDEGLRSGEVRRLKLDDINFSENYIVIRQTKGMKNRVLPLTAVCKKYLLEYIQFKRPEVTHKYVFCNLDHSPLTKEALKTLFDRLKKSTGISRIYPHLLRHTFGTSFILGGGSLEILRHYMGHSDIATTENYLHIANNYRFCENIYRLDPVFKKEFY